MLRLCVLLFLVAYLADGFFVAQQIHSGLSRRASTSMLFNFGQKTKAAGPSIPKDSKIVVITGTTSGLGKSTVRALLNKKNYFVVCANRDVEKMKEIAALEKFDESKLAHIDLDLASFDSTRKFVGKLNSIKGSRPLDNLICNAAVTSQHSLRFTADGFEEQLQINHLSHFLLLSLLLPDIKRGKNGRVIVVGSITGNDNTVGGGVVLPIADLGELKGLEAGGKDPVSMISGEAFNGAKAYKDPKICNMMTANELHERYHASTGVTFGTMYPGCIATTQLFREKRQWFRTLFPLFMRYVTGGFVGEEEAGERLAQTIDDPRCVKSGVYWSWNGGAKTVGYLEKQTDGKIYVRGAGGAGGELFENEPSAKVRDRVKAKKMWDYSTKITGAKWL